VESWLHRVEPGSKPIALDDEVYRTATWTPCQLEAEPRDWTSILPSGVRPQDVLGFDPKSGRALVWPLRYSMVSWTASLPALQTGIYEFRARAVDGNGFAQPEPRPIPKSGKNGVEVRRFEVI